MSAEELPAQPSLAWRTGSAFTMGAVGFLCRSFLLGLNRLEVNGLEQFLELLDERQDVESRTRGLITGRHCHIRHVEQETNKSLPQWRTMSACTYVATPFL